MKTEVKETEVKDITNIDIYIHDQLINLCDIGAVTKLSERKKDIEQGFKMAIKPTRGRPRSKPVGVMNRSVWLTREDIKRIAAFAHAEKISSIFTFSNT